MPAHLAVEQKIGEWRNRVGKKRYDYLINKF
jgi:hypothetical protein